MLLLIDAYNLLHHSDVMQRGRGPGWLEQARGRLIRVLLEHLGPALSAETCLVFDAATPPPGASSDHLEGGMRIRFAVTHAEADDLLEEMIAAHSAPKRLMVVSSDHRIQRAAARRDARFMDADLWYAELCERGPRLAVRAKLRGELSGGGAGGGGPEKPAGLESAGRVEQWLEYFGLDELAVDEAETHRGPSEVEFQEGAKLPQPRRVPGGLAKPTGGATASESIDGELAGAGRKPSGGERAVRGVGNQVVGKQGGGAKRAASKRVASKRVAAKRGSAKRSGRRSKDKTSPDKSDPNWKPPHLDGESPFPEGYGEDLGEAFE